MEIVIASTNLHKIREFRDIMKHLAAIDLLSLLNFPTYEPLPEEAPSFKENAINKAVHAAKTLNKWVLADDSGLVVPGLNGVPGVRSRRYAGDDATDAENRLKLLAAMESFDGHRRDAYYECCLVLASPAGMKKCVTGLCEGKILREERGRNGFGYDSLFVKNEYDKSFAEIDESTKNRISHRHKAFEKIAPTLETLVP
ncbi:MAG TPA: RdgB/HAM1 family non-canonical purine NTP pyrophosphatase [Parachlamydiaceae bacterium]|nr:RdgB/HAM1 family non-canonical purine NTP pyrophosphatase [Parachlamydiaceae bacterium]